MIHIRKERLEELLRGRTRLAWATGALGFTAGIIFHTIITMPPVWLDDLQAVSTCIP
ncbi:hypothetical protein [Corynebacterium pyruviciproducens]|uniref:hypothetical protein n=1 Tax=Corynebacterium pyruviciproducens TaxID=598660 RepID=UPI00288BC1A8|nr:hypothetical protein [Corynebacterium pyruviciproducens]